MILTNVNSSVTTNIVLDYKNFDELTTCRLCLRSGHG